MWDAVARHVSQLRYPALSPLWGREKSLLRVWSQVSLWYPVTLLPPKVTFAGGNPCGLSLPAHGTRWDQGTLPGRMGTLLLLSALLGEDAGLWQGTGDPPRGFSLRTPSAGRTGSGQAAAARPSLDHTPPARQLHLQRQEMHFL